MLYAEIQRWGIGLWAGQRDQVWTEIMSTRRQGIYDSVVSRRMHILPYSYRHLYPHTPETKQSQIVFKNRERGLDRHILPSASPHRGPHHSLISPPLILRHTPTLSMLPGGLWRGRYAV